MVAGGLEVTTQENLATEPSVTAAGTGCNANSEIPAENHPASAAAVACFSKRSFLYLYHVTPLSILSPEFDGC